MTAHATVAFRSMWYGGDVLEVGSGPRAAWEGELAAWVAGTVLGGAVDATVRRPLAHREGCACRLRVLSSAADADGACHATQRVARTPPLPFPCPKCMAACGTIASAAEWVGSQAAGGDEDSALLRADFTLSVVIESEALDGAAHLLPVIS